MTCSGAWAGSVARGCISKTKAATGLQQRPTERPMSVQHVAENSRLLHLAIFDLPQAGQAGVIFQLKLSRTFEPYIHAGC